MYAYKYHKKKKKNRKAKLHSLVLIFPCGKSSVQRVDMVPYKSGSVKLG